MTRAWLLLASLALVSSCKATSSGGTPGGGDTTGAAGEGGPPTMNATAGTGGAAGAGGAPASTGAAGATAGGNDAAASSTPDAAADLEDPIIHEEVDAAPPSADAIAATGNVQATLEMLATQVQGARVVFVDCTVTPCTARVAALTLAALRDLLVKVSASFNGRVSFVAREKFDGFTGQSFEADLVLGTDKPRAVPATPEELLDEPGM